MSAGMKAGVQRQLGLTLLMACGIVTLLAGSLAPNAVDERFEALLYAPPTAVHVRDDTGRWRRPFIYPWRIVSRLERRFIEDRAHPVPLEWLTGGRLVTSRDPAAPFLLLGADGFGRDIFARLLHGGRISLSLALAATAGAILAGVVLGGLGGYAGGLLDEVLSRLSDLALVLPITYVVLSLRAVMPLVLRARYVFLLMAAIFIGVGWPFAARGVRAIIAAERHREYALAAKALGASHARVMLRHVLPAVAGFAAVQATLLFPAFILAEATLSYVGLGFPDSTPSWGTMLHDAANVAMLGEAPWALAPAGAIFVVVLAINLAFDRSGEPRTSNPESRVRLPIQ